MSVEAWKAVLGDSGDDSGQMATRKKIVIATAPNRRIAARFPNT
jgi:hypothetical protein